MQYHVQKDETGRGIEIGDILKVTPDGEAELPPGQTPKPSRQNSGRIEELEDGDGGLKEPKVENQQGAEKKQDAAAESSKQERQWSSGTDRPRASSSHARFSSFRDSTHSDGHREDREHRESSDEDHSSQSPQAREQAQRRWSALRSRVLPKAANGGSAPGPNKVTALSHTAIASVPVTTELLAGQLPVMILKTWLDRDDEGNRAVPVLLGNLRFRVGDSVGLRAGKETGKEMFKVECEYGDGVVKWVNSWPLSLPPS